MMRAASALLFVLFALLAAAAETPPEYPAPLTPELTAALAEAERLLSQDKAFPAARERFQHLVGMAAAAGDEITRVRALAGLGGALWGVGDYAAALAAYEQALPPCRALLPARCESALLSRMGNTFLSMSRYEEARVILERALEAGPPAPGSEATTLANLGLAHRYLGRYSKARGLFLRSLELRRGIGDTAGVGQSLNHLGMLSRAGGWLQEALGHHQAALALRRRGGDRQGEAQSLNNLANVYSDLGQQGRSIELYVQAREIAKETGYAAQVGFSDQNIGNSLVALGRDAEARPHLEAALAVFRKIDRRAEVADTLGRLGELDIRAGRLETLRPILDESLEIARAVGAPELVARSLEHSADLDLRTGAAAGALARLDEALELVRGGTPDIEYSVRARRGRALRALGRQDAAIAELVASARIVNDLRARLTGDAGKIGFLDERRSVFEDLAAALTDSGRHGEALEAAEAARARAFSDLLLQREVRAREAESDALDAVRVALDESRARATTPPGPERASERGADAVDEALGRLRERNAELASLVVAESPSLDDMRRVAAGLGATTLTYLPTEGSLLMWVISPEGTLNAAAVPMPRAKLVSQVERLRAAIEATDGPSLAQPGRLRPLLRALDDALVAPVARWLPSAAGAVVVVVPDAALALVPFAALTDRRGRTLAERHTIAVAPSLSVFRYTRRPAPAKGAFDAALVIADPTPPEGAGLGSIPASRAEGRAVARRLGAGTRMLAGASATEAEVKRSGPRASLLHFATHGLVSPRRPLDSSLVLAAGGGEDGYLRAAEVFGLDLDARLVVLSGCSTGVGPASGDGVLGLTRAFLYAGTPSVVVSLWDVSDVASAALMDRFYAELRRGRGKARALRTAQLATRARYPHPALWAAFALVGEPE